MEYNVIIIGAGVSGMTSAIYLKRAGISCCIIEEKAPGGQLNYISTIENYPGNSKIGGTDLAYNIYNQVNELGIPFIFEQVKEIKTKKDKNIVITEKKQLETEYIIIATGRSPKKLNVQKEDNLFGKGISYCAICDGPLYKDKEVVVVGAGDSAIKESLFLSNICSKVTILIRKNSFRGKDNIGELRKRKNIIIKYNSEIDKFRGEENLERIILKNKEEISCDACFIFIGYHPSTEKFKNLSITDHEGYIKTDEFCKTNKKNIFAIGDVRKKDIFQIITAMNDGVIAATTIINKKIK